MTKKIIIFILATIIIAVGYYLLSPLWIVVEVEESSPLAGLEKQVEKAEIDSEAEEGEIFVENTENLSSDELLNDLLVGNQNQESGDAKAVGNQETIELETEKKEVIKKEEPVFPRLVSQASFLSSSSYDVEGKALWIEEEDKTTIRFEDFQTQNGPNLHIYLGADLEGNDFVDLGPIKGTKGNVNYTIPEGVDLTKYNKVMIWCVPFEVLFGHADLK